MGGRAGWGCTSPAPRRIGIGLLGAEAAVPGGEVNAQMLQQPGLARRRAIAGGSWQICGVGRHPQNFRVA